MWRFSETESIAVPFHVDKRVWYLSVKYRWQYLDVTQNHSSRVLLMNGFSYLTTESHLTLDLYPKAYKCLSTFSIWFRFCMNIVLPLLQTILRVTQYIRTHRIIHLIVLARNLFANFSIFARCRIRLLLYIVYLCASILRDDLFKLCH